MFIKKLKLRNVMDVVKLNLMLKLKWNVTKNKISLNLPNI